MKRTILFLLVFCMLLTGLFAQNATHVTAERARNIGYTFMSTNPAAPASPTRGSSVSRDAMQLVYTGRAVDSTTRGTTDCYYVFSLQPKGFVIVAADERAEPVLGYSYDNDFVVENMPNHVRGWLGGYEQQIKAAIDQNLAPDAEIAAKWTRLEAGQPLSNTRSGETVGPLLTTTWDQGQYYNALCPEDANGPDGHVWTGCVATAMAQLINYWGYPAHGRGTHSYESNYGTLTVNYDSARYNYANMPDALTEASTPEQINAVATLMRDCGVAVNMMYSASSSSSYDIDARAALINFFRFSSDYAQRDVFIPNEWDALLKENLDANYPIIYSGQGNVGGHSFVCDGYTADNYYHFNFGWSGNGDGWYLTVAINPGSYNFNTSQSALIGIVPDSTGNYILGQREGTSTFTVDEPLEFYHLLGHNTYLGTNYTNSCTNTVTFISADTTTQLVLDIISFENQNVTVYDGISETELSAHSSSSDKEPIVLPSYALTLLYQGTFNHTGFHLFVSKDSECRMVSNISSWFEIQLWQEGDETTEWQMEGNLFLDWQENGESTEWQVEYGPHGFSHGEGISFTTDGSANVIPLLVKIATYDFYIKPTCSRWWFGPIIVEIAPYWTDIVVEEPEGYTILENGTVAVSTAEGLAWWAKQNMLQYGEPIPPQPNLSIVADIDLDGYLWKPVPYYSGCINGFGHSIKNMLIKEYDPEDPYNEIESCGFIGDYAGDTLQDICFINPVVKTKRNGSGVIAGRSQSGIMRNCCVVDGFVEGKRWVGLLVGEGCKSITNCYAIGEVHGEGVVGGLIGHTGVIANCWTNISEITWLKIDGPNPNWHGLVLAYGGNHIRNCFSEQRDQNDDKKIGDFVGYYDELSFTENISGFFSNDSCAILATPIIIDTAISDLTEGLNAYIQNEINSTGYRTWIWDDSSKHPTFGDYYQVYCPNVDSLSVKTIEIEGNYSLVVSWTSDNSIFSQLRITPLDTTDGPPFYRMVNAQTDTISGLTLGHSYRIAIRSWCDMAHHSGWGKSETILFDKFYWTDIVTEQPSSYIMDDEGNVTITSAEGLSWLSSVVNGLNNVSANDFQGKKIWLEADIDLDGYRWFSIGKDGLTAFRGYFYGNSHVISNLYCKEEITDPSALCCGLFGCVRDGIIDGVTITNANINGYSGVGVVVGRALNTIISNCNAQGIVFGTQGVGGIAGGIGYDDLYYIPPIRPKIFNCSFRGTIYGDESAGGLVAGAGRTTIENSFAQCEIFPTGLNHLNLLRGGFTGELSSSVVKNCYSKSKVHYYGLLWNFGIAFGVITGDYETSTYNFYYENNDSILPFSNCENCLAQIIDTSSFTLQETVVQLETPITIEDSSYTNMLDALNKWVIMQNNPSLRLWVTDSIGFPVFGEFLSPSCHTPDSIQIEDFTRHQDSTLIRVSWTIKGNPSYYEVRCLYYDNDTIIRNYRTDSTSCWIDDLPIGDISISVRAFCDSISSSPWCTPIHTTIQCPYYWTDIVTSQPESFKIINKKVIISSVEDMAWLCSVMNGLNNTSNQEIDTILLANDIDMRGYKWKPIESFNAVLDGRNHIIKNIYINDLGFRGSLTPGGLITYNHGVIKNVNLKNTNIYGYVYVSGFVSFNYGSIINCCSEGNVHGLAYIGGLSCDNQGRIENCYVRSQIRGREPSIFLYLAKSGVLLEHDNALGDYFSGLVMSNENGIINNCYFAGTIDYFQRESATIVVHNYVTQTTSTITNCFSNRVNPSIPLIALKDYFVNPIISNLTFFQKEGYNLPLQQRAVINSVYYTDLVSALNAWVDAHASESEYCHWIADTMNINDGFPLFEVIPCNTIISSDSIVACDSYFWQDSIYTSSSILVELQTTINGCDSIVTHHLTINHPTAGDTIATSCSSFSWYSDILTQSGDYTHMLTNANGCDSTVTLHLTIHNATEGDTTATACGSFDWYGDNLTQSGDYTHLFENGNANGCDSTVTLHLTLYQPTATDEYLTICENELPYHYVNDDIDTTFEVGTPSLITIPYTLSTIHGCDSIITLHLTIHNATEGDTTATACGSFNWYGENLTTTGDYTHVLTNANGCDSIITLHLTINEPTFSDTTAIACDYFTWNGNIYTQSGNYTSHLTNANGCDSTVTLHLTVYALTVGDTTVVACEGFEWYGDYLIESSNYHFIFENGNANGCDSIFCLHLTINNSTESDTTATACGSFEWYGDNLTESGDYSHIFENGNANGCDSTVTLHLTLYQPTTTDEYLTICENELPYHYVNDDIDTTFEVGTPSLITIPYTLSTIHGCDSTVTLHLTINNATAGDTTAIACGSFNWYGENLTATGDYTHMLTNANGCDSIITLHLTINEPTFSDTTAIACDYFTWNGNIYTQSGNYTSHLTNANGCDSTVTLHLTVHALTVGDTTVVACEGFEWYGDYLIESSNYHFIFENGNANGCDSIFCLHLTIHNATEGDTTATACGSFEWYGDNLTESGDYPYIFENGNANGCDSTVTLHLTLYQPTTTDEYLTICESDLPYHYVNGDIDTTFEVGTPSLNTIPYTLSTIHGCDSIITLHLTIHNATEGDTTATACGSFDWYGENLTATGDYTHMLTNANGCDSTVTLHLTTHNATEGDTTATACGSFEWYGENLTATGDYTHMLTNANGCDSIITLHLTIHNATEGDTTATACGSFTWNDSVYTQSGDYSQTFTNAQGCDSIVTLHLTVNNATEGDTTATACDSFNWYGDNLTQSGDYTHLFENGNANGCDSIVTLHLTIKNGTYSSFDTTVCDGYEWHDSTYTESGTYVFEYTNETDCPSADTLYLTVTTINTEIDGTNEEVHLIDPQENATYQWIDCETNEPMEGDIADYFGTLIEGGGYYACIITFGDCTDTTECWHIYPDDITENEMGILILYPNPTDGTVTVQLAPETCNLTPEIQMFDIYGRRLQIIPVTDETTPIDLSRYANGVYFVKLVNNGKVVAVRKVVKE